VSGSFRLVVEKGQSKGAFLRLKQNGLYVAGRESGNALTLKDRQASRKHFQVEAKLGELRPHLGTPAIGRLRNLAARLEVILVLKQALHGIAEQRLLFGERKIHLPTFPRCCSFARTLKAEHHFCDDVVLDLVRSAIDRSLAHVEIILRNTL